MKNTVLVLLIVVSLTACASVKSTSRGMAEDLGSPEKIELLSQRINDFWTAFMKEDYEKIYYLYDPFFQAGTNKYAFMGTLGMVKYHKFEIKDIKVEGNVAEVKLSLVYSMSKVKLKLTEFTVSETPAEIEETWLYIYDNWHKEFYMHALEKGVVYY